MDRCRCEDYAEAVRRLRFYTPGTYRPDIIDGYDRSQYSVRWVRHGVELCDDRFEKARAWSKRRPGDCLPRKMRRIEQMWCPYMLNPRS